MNTNLLRLARRHPNGSRRWAVKGAGNGVLLLPSRLSPFHAPTVYWPHREPDGTEVRRGVRLDWHHALARKGLLSLIDNSQSEYYLIAISS